MAKGFKHNQKKHPRKFMVYVPDEYQDIVTKAKQIMEREGQSLSQKFVKFCADYVHLHGPGNPQLLVTSFFGESQLKTKCHCGGLASHEVWAENGWHGYLCKSCFCRDREAGLLKRWKPL